MEVQQQGETQFSFRMAADIREGIERIAQAEERTLSSVVRHALKRYLRDHQTDPDTKVA
jgi:predicted transcriptional regulator